VRPIQQRDAGRSADCFVLGGRLADNEASELGEAPDGGWAVLACACTDIKASLGSAARVAAATRPCPTKFTRFAEQLGAPAWNVTNTPGGIRRRSSSQVRCPPWKIFENFPAGYGV
jgi:hypothetical protein